MISIVGGGVIGLSIGWYLAKEGAKVTLFEEDVCGRDASWASAGMLAPHLHSYPQSPGVTETATLMLELEQRSYSMWAAFSEELQQASGTDIGRRMGGSLAVGFSPDEESQLKADYELQREHGLDIQWLSAKEALEMEPALSPSLVAASFSPLDGQVDPRSVLKALREAYLRAGGELREHCPVRSVEIENDRVRGIGTSDGTVPTDKVVVAAGAWSGQISGVPEAARPPVHPVKGQMVALGTDPQNRPLTHIVFGRGGYYIPRTDGRLVVGTTMEAAGFDTTNTVTGILGILRRASETVPQVGTLPIVEMWTGLRPRSTDGAPVLGPTSVDGLVMATGHFHVGVVLAPITAQLIGRCLLDDKVPDAMAPFGIGRFQGAGPRTQAL